MLTLPDGVTNLKPPIVQELTDSLVERRWIDAGPNGLAGKRVEITGLQFTITDALVRVELLDGRTVQTIARPSQPWVEIAATQAWWEVMGTYVVEGIRHILFGADHLLFVLGLLLIVGERVDAGEDGHRLHRRSQHHARHRYARRRECPGAAAQCRDRLEHSLSRTGDCSRLARRDELHDPSPVGGGVRVRAAARIRIRHGA